MFKSKKKQIAELINENTELRTINNELADALEDMLSRYPLNIGEEVYELKLKSAKGRFTKTKASLKYSTVETIVVDTRNYFNLVEKLNNNELYVEREAAEVALKSICTEE